MKTAVKVLYIHKYEQAQQYGGPEEGGWWFQSGTPVKEWQSLEFPIVSDEDEDKVFELCRCLNHLEYRRQEIEEKYEYTSVCSYLSRHFGFDVSEEKEPKAYPQERPHYE